jgi:uncharacterized YigZ family protein
MADIDKSDTMAQPYQTLDGEGESEIVVERSRFIGFARPVESVEAADSFVESLETQHYDARHVCYGLRVGRGPQSIDRSNDDGEPARTGGFPLWQLLDGEEVTDAIIAVVRYYGGVKLGTGGLARAYRECGRLALEDAGTVTRYPEVRFEVSVPYNFVGKLEHFIDEDEAIRVVETDYAADVRFAVAVREIALDAVRARLSGLLQRPVESIGSLDEDSESEDDDA